jgi:hypothetical protein
MRRAVRVGERGLAEIMGVSGALEMRMPLPAISAVIQ